MQLHLTADKEARLSRIAAYVGTSAEHIVLTTALRVVEVDDQRRCVKGWHRPG